LLLFIFVLSLGKPLDEADPASVALLGSLRRVRLICPCSVIEPYLEVTNSETAGIREKLNLSQPVFAAMLNIPTVTAISWERGRRKPTGAALRLLDIARRSPNVLMA
jgi:hypothetical protein